MKTWEESLLEQLDVVTKERDDLHRMHCLDLDALLALTADRDKAWHHHRMSLAERDSALARIAEARHRAEVAEAERAGALAEFVRLVQLNTDLTIERDKAIVEAGAVKRAILFLGAERDRLRTALAWYAAESNHEGRFLGNTEDVPCNVLAFSFVSVDAGNRARAALAADGEAP